MLPIKSKPIIIDNKNFDFAAIDAALISFEHHLTDEQITIDFSNVLSGSSAVILFLIKCQQLAKRHKINLKFINIPKFVNELIAVYQLDFIWDI